MSRIVTALYREPVLFAGVVTAVAVALGAANQIPDWIGVVVAAGFAPVTRQFTKPARR
jgi:hypothetical protein